MNTFDPAALECLAAIVEEGGFERAAQRLSITQSAVSQRLRALEAQVGTVLIVRSRPLKPASPTRQMPGLWRLPCFSYFSSPNFLLEISTLDLFVL